MWLSAGLAFCSSSNPVTFAPIRAASGQFDNMEKCHKVFYKIWLLTFDIVQWIEDGNCIFIQISEKDKTHYGILPVNSYNYTKFV